MVDKIVFNPLERAVSTDLNRLQDVTQDVMAEAFKYLQAFQTISGFAIGGGEVPVSTFAGLSLRFDVPGIANMSPGVLFQLNATYPDSPTTDQSDYRIGINRESVALGENFTALGFYIVECQVVDVAVESQNRDQFDKDTQTFENVLVTKKTQRQVVFSTKFDATNFPLPSGGNFVPVALVHGTSIGPNIFDVRSIPSDRNVPSMGLNLQSGTVDNGTLRASSMGTANARSNPNVYLNTLRHVHLDGIASNFHMWRSGVGDSQVDIRATTPNAYDISNLWMCMITGAGFPLLPKHGGFESYFSQGLLIQTHNLTFPGRNSYTNDVVVEPPFPALPVPWSNYTVGDGHALHVGSAFAGDNGTNFEWFDQNHGGVCHHDSGPVKAGAPSARTLTTGRLVFNIPTGTNDPALSPVIANLGGNLVLDAKIPNNCKSVNMTLSFSDISAASPLAMQVIVTNSVGGQIGRGSIICPTESSYRELHFTFAVGSDANRDQLWEIFTDVADTSAAWANIDLFVTGWTI